MFDEWYQAGMSDEELSEVAREFVGNDYITCDSAEPKTIDFLVSKGVKAVPAMKGADSINRGIRWLQGHKIVIHSKCQNFKNEIEQYHWQEINTAMLWLSQWIKITIYWTLSDTLRSNYS